MALICRFMFSYSYLRDSIQVVLSLNDFRESFIKDNIEKISELEDLLFEVEFIIFSWF